MKIKKIVLALLTVVTILGVSPLQASDFVFDTRIGVYTSSMGSILFRNSRLAYDTSKLMPNTAIRAEYFVLDGVALTGGLDSFRVGLQAVYKMNVCVGAEFSPFIGLNTSKNNITDLVLSGSVGFDCKSKLLSFADGVAGCDIDIYSDTYMCDYFAGLSLPLMSSLSLDLLYNGMLSNGQHKLGFSGRVNFGF